MKLTNSPPRNTILRLEARKSFSFVVKFDDDHCAPVDLTDCTVSMDWVTTLIRNPQPSDFKRVLAEIDDPPSGECRFDLQAADLDLKPGSYPYTLTLLTDSGYSLVFDKGELDIQSNTESNALTSTYPDGDPTIAIDVTLKGQNVVCVTLSSALPPNTVILNESQIAKLQAIPPGGATGQALVKRTDVDYQTEWKTILGEKGEPGPPGPQGASAYRKNLTPNPSFEVSLLGWEPLPGPGGTAAINFGMITVVPHPEVGGTRAAHVTWVAPTASPGTGWSHKVDAIPAGGQMGYVASAYVKSNVAQIVEMQILAMDAGAGQVLKTVQGIPITLVPNAWTRVSATIFTPELTATIVPRVVVANMVGAVPWKVNDLLDVDGVLVEHGSVVRDYFDGETEGFAWEGYPHESVTIEESLIGPQGLPGVSSNAFSYIFEPGITPPQAGFARANDALPQLATRLYLAYIAQSGINVAALLRGITQHDGLIIQDVLNAEQHVQFDVSAAIIDHPAEFYAEIPVTFTSGPEGPMANGQDVLVFHTARGVQGDQGIPGGPGPAGENSQYFEQPDTPVGARPGAGWYDTDDPTGDVVLRQPKVEIFAASGTWTKPDSALYVEVEMVGGGGGGAGCSTTVAGECAMGAGGSGAGYARKRFDAAALLPTENVVVGVAGAAGTAGGVSPANNGGNGGTSSFSTVSAFGGGGGIAGAASTNAGNTTSVEGGVGAGGDAVMRGGYNIRGLRAPAANFVVGGGGGSTAISPGGVPCTSPNANGATPASNSQGCGGGGGANSPGQATARSGGAGSAGLVIVRTYFH